jgi:hypothetical protein
LLVDSEVTGGTIYGYVFYSMMRTRWWWWRMRRPTGAGSPSVMAWRRNEPAVRRPIPVIFRPIGEHSSYTTPRRRGNAYLLQHGFTGEACLRAEHDGGHGVAARQPVPAAMAW